MVSEPAMAFVSMRQWNALNVERDQLFKLLVFILVQAHRQGELAP